MKIRVALVDDDEKIRGQLSGLLEIYNSFDVVKELDNEQEANDYIFTNQVDAVFIKLQLGNPKCSGDGSYLAFNLTSKCPDLIIVIYSVIDEKASIINMMNFADFFVLPFDSVKMQRVVNRIEYLYDLLQYKRRSINRSVMIKTNKGYQLVTLDSVLFIERYDRKNRMITTDGKEIILGGYSLDELERLLAPNNFYRCYQSFIVNLSKVSFVKVDNETKNYTLLFKDFAGEVMLSRGKYNEIIELLKNMYAGISL
jgi:DNA-binding LytR/AlgR family response regulator